MFFTPIIPTFKEENPARSEGNDFSKTPLFTVGRRERKSKARSTPETAQEMPGSILGTGVEKKDVFQSVNIAENKYAEPDIQPLERIMSQASRSGVVDLAGLAAAVNELLFAAGVRAQLPPPPPNLCLALSEGGSETGGEFLKEMEREELFTLLLHLDSGVSRSLQRRAIEELAERDQDKEDF